MHQSRLKHITPLLSSLLALVACPSPACSQDRIVVRENQQWIQYYGQLRLTENWLLTGDTGFRWKDGLTASHQHIVRAGGLYKAGGSVQLGGGLAHSGIYEAGSVEQREWRLYEEVGFKNSFRFLELAHRLRIEQRFQHPTPFTVRFRYSLMASIPLFVLSSGNGDFRLSFRAGDELFINSLKKNSINLFDQNRIVAGPVIHLGDALSMAVLWNSQYAATSLPSTYRQTHVIWLQVRHTFSLPNKETSL